MTDKQILLGAVDYINKHGWQQHSLGFHGQSRCLLGACRSNIPNGEYTTDGWFCFLDRLRHLFGMEPAQWNDTVATSPEEVITKLQQIAATLP